MGIPEVELDNLSYSAVPLKMMVSANDKEVVRGNGTGFFVSKNSKKYLITNRHVISGIKKPGDTLPADRPQFVNYPVLKHKKPHIQWHRLNTKLYLDDGFKKPTWLIHPKYGADVDVVALEIDMSYDHQALYINEFKFDNLKPLVSDDVFILGFPYGNKGGGNFPIWKRGTIATEPDIDLDDLPKVYVDTASREGMSGSPVLLRRDGVHNLNEDGQLHGESFFGEAQSFVGIYSGRFKDTENDPDDLKAQLGIIWKAQVIDEIIDGGVFDTFK